MAHSWIVVRVPAAILRVHAGRSANATAAVVATLAAGLVALALTGCGADQSQQVQAKLQQYDHAVSARQPGTLCRQILTGSLVARLEAATGLSCIQAMTTYVDSVTDPTLSVSKVTVNGDHAAAVVLAGAQGQQAAFGTIHLTLGPHGWRIDSLTQPR